MTRNGRLKHSSPMICENRRSFRGLGTNVCEFGPGRTVRRNGRTANLFGFSNFYVRFRKYETRWWFLMQELNITPCVLKRFSRIKNNADKIINCTIICFVILPLFLTSAGHEVKRRQKLISRCSMTFRVVKSLEMPPFNACFVNI